MYLPETKTSSGARQTKQHESMNVDMSSLVVTLMLCSVSAPLVAKNHTVEEQETRKLCLSLKMYL